MTQTFYQCKTKEWHQEEKVFPPRLLEFVAETNFKNNDNDCDGVFNDDENDQLPGKYQLFLELNLFQWLILGGKDYFFGHWLTPPCWGNVHKKTPFPRDVKASWMHNMMDQIVFLSTPA